MQNKKASHNSRRNGRLALSVDLGATDTSSPAMPRSTKAPRPRRSHAHARTTATLEAEPADAPRKAPPPPPPLVVRTAPTERPAMAPARRSARIAASRDARRPRQTANLDHLSEPGLYVYVALALVEDRVGPLLYERQVRGHRPACPPPAPDATVRRAARRAIGMTTSRSGYHPSTTIRAKWP